MRCILQFWDTRTPNPMMTMQLPERVYCADVVRTLCLCTVIRGHLNTHLICCRLHFMLRYTESNKDDKFDRNKHDCLA